MQDSNFRITVFFIRQYQNYVALFHLLTVSPSLRLISGGPSFRLFVYIELKKVRSSLISTTVPGPAPGPTQSPIELVKRPESEAIYIFQG